MIVDESDVIESRDMVLSEIAEDFRIVRFDNRDDAFFHPGMPSFSDNYIAVGKDPVKLFDRDGGYICDIGAVGNGPGEYSIGAYDVLVDEEAGRIYVVDFNRVVNAYDLQGNFVGNITVGAPLHKGKLFKHPDGTLSAVHLCFKEDDSPFVAANFDADMAHGDTVRYAYAPQLAVGGQDESGAKIGFGNEVWSYRCGDTMTFHTTFNDTLYAYNNEANRLDAVFTLDMSPERRGDAYYVYQDLPGVVLANIVGGDNGGTVVVDKSSLSAVRLGKKVNDYFFDLEGWGWSFHDGYAFGIYEPMMMHDRLQKAIDEGRVAEGRLQEVREFMATLNENDNNVMLVARLRGADR